MNRLAVIIYTFFLVSCEEPVSKLTEDPWKGFSEHEKIFSCMYSGDVDRFPESVKPVEDYALIIKGHWESPEGVPEISAVIGSKQDGTIRTAIGLNAMEELFSTIEPNSTIRRYYKCTAPLTYNVPQEELSEAEELIPEGLIWSGDVESGENVICTCPKR
jgi:hypothetical protein